MSQGRTGMTEMEKGSWEDTLKTLTRSLIELSKEANGGDLSDIGDIEKQLKWVREDQMNLDNPEMIREVDLLLSEVMRFLNDAETEVRREQDDNIRHLNRCQDLGRDSKGLAEKFKRLESKV